jgi:hypothetical protein
MWPQVYDQRRSPAMIAAGRGSSNPDYEGMLIKTQTHMTNAERGECLMSRESLGLKAV